MAIKETKKITSINSAEQKKYLSDILIKEEFTENTISETLGVSENIVIEFLEKCYMEAEFQYQSNKILISLVNEYLKIDKKSLNDELILENFKSLMGMERTYDSKNVE